MAAKRTTYRSALIIVQTGPLGHRYAWLSIAVRWAYLANSRAPMPAASQSSVARAGGLRRGRLDEPCSGRSWPPARPRVLPAAGAHFEGVSKPADAAAMRAADREGAIVRMGETLGAGRREGPRDGGLVSGGSATVGVAAARAAAALVEVVGAPPPPELCGQCSSAGPPNCAASSHRAAAAPSLAEASPTLLLSGRRSRPKRWCARRPSRRTSRL